MGWKLLQTLIIGAVLFGGVQGGEKNTFAVMLVGIATAAVVTEVLSALFDLLRRLSRYRIPRFVRKQQPFERSQRARRLS